ncbi:hypothetical protein FHG87_008068 [Trinorchestia longiramus]|nr:hypothetical protein FHG87_008068 [Trinorchestia longiramus]
MGSTAPLECFTAPQGAVVPTLGITDLDHWLLRECSVVGYNLGIFFVGELHCWCDAHSEQLGVVEVRCGCVVFWESFVVLVRRGRGSATWLRGGSCVYGSGEKASSGEASAPSPPPSIARGHSVDFHIIADMSKQSIARQGRSDSEVSQTEKDLAQKALKEFNNCNYSSALNLLLKLEELRPHDIKLQHNKAVCEFFKSGLTNVDAFHKALHDIIIQCSKGKSHGRGPDMPTSNEPTLSLLNLAVVYYHQLNYSVAIDLLAPLYAALESLDETVGMRVCLLLISAHLLSSNAEEAQNVIQRTRSILLPQPLPSTGDDTPVSSPHHDSCHGDSRNVNISASASAGKL